MTTDTDKRRERMIKHLRAQGFAIAYTNRGHIRYQAPNGKIFYSPSTSNSSSGLRNFQSLIHRETGINPDPARFRHAKKAPPHSPQKRLTIDTVCDNNQSRQGKETPR